MKVCEGRSFSGDPSAAVAEATAGWSFANKAPEMVFAFCSTQQDAGGVAAALAAKYPDSPVVGCTTTGEQLCGVGSNGALVVAALADSGIRWATTKVELANFGAAEARAASDRLFGALAVEREAIDPSHFFCLLFVDGLAKKEETLAALVADAIEGIALVGGSAGDDLAFKQTRVIYGAEAQSGTAVLVMGHAIGRFEVLKHQHYTTTPRQLVVTKVDLEARRVDELDGLPALEAYAKALGLRPDEVTDQVTFMNPVTFSCDGEIYVRSIQRVEPDGALTFYCALEEGMVLEIGDHHDMKDSLRRDLSSLVDRIGKADFMLTYNCILRALEAKNTGQREGIAELLQGAAKVSIGFDTYGEQLNGLHINQTLVGIAFREPA